MKLKSLILGSVAAAGLSTAGYAADLGVLTSLDVCDALGLSGLTISSDTNCLQISGEVKYEFSWGDYAGNWLAVPLPAGFIVSPAGATNVIDNNGAGALTNDWSSKVESWLKFVGTADSDFGPASATIKLKNVDQWVVTNEAAPVAGGDHTGGNIVIDEAYVSIGDTTVIMAGKKGSIANKDDDAPFNWLGLFNSSKVDTGVDGKSSVVFGPAVPFPATGGHVIQVVSSLGNGVTVKGGLEKLDTTGTAVGVLEYAGEGITAHITGAAGGILTGAVTSWGLHAGVTGTFDNFKVRAAGAFTSNTVDTFYNLLASGEATFDMFKIALSAETAGGSATPTTVGVGGSIGATVTEGVSINLGARWFDENTAVANTEGYQVAAQLVAAVTETVSITGEVGVYGTTYAVAPESQTDFYGKAQLDWKPGGGFTSSLAGEVHQNGAYKVTFKAAKEFK